MNAKLNQTIIDLHGDLGRAWLNDLPKIIADIEQHWSIQVAPPFAELS